MERVALLGYGSFGRVLEALLEAAGVPLRAYDPEAPVPGELRAGSLGELVADAGVVVLSVPLPELPSALARLRPHLTREHLVLDVCSVKVRPVEVLASVLGADVPWVGTHPLFGPGSVARGERPLRAVVCPNPLHPEAAAQASALYRRLGCQVLEASADAHDQAMARTQALPLFLARGMLEAGISPEEPLAPPSFTPLAQLLVTAGREAPHLLSAVQTENPYAREVREQVLEALARAHRELEQVQPEAPPAPAAPVSAELAEARAAIDALDLELLGLLERRLTLARRAAEVKAREGRPVMDAGREAQLLDVRRQWAGERGLDAEGVEAVFRAVLRLSRRTLQGG